MCNARKRVAFIGLGIMGGHMAGHVLRAGHDLHVFNRTRSKADALVAAGAIWHDRPASAAEGADFIITIVGFPHDVEDLYLGRGELLARARPETVLVDMTTSSPALAIRIDAAAKARGVPALDAPVSGGEAGAREAKLSIMVGGDDAAFASASPILSLMGTNIVHQGGPGAGQHTKLCNQIVIGGTMLGVAEGLTYALRSGLDADKVLRSIGTGAAGSILLTALGPKMLNSDFAPGFFIEHFVKDLTLAAQEAERAGLSLDGLHAVLSRYKHLIEKGLGRAGTQALIKAYEPGTANV